jgi:hypothetical protein
MIDKHKSLNFDFRQAAVYKIVVKGEINKEWSESIWRFQVNRTAGKEQNTISTLIGRIDDQAALSGILNKLYDNHITVISVNMLTEIENG